MSKGSSTPPTPDYKGAAQETAAGNLEMAKYATEANRANQYTPWGSVEWTNDRVFDQQAYDAALAAYQQGLINPPAAAPQGPPPEPSWWANMDAGDWANADWEAWGVSPQSTSATSSLTPPNPEDFYTGGNRWSQTVNLSPEMQALFDQENRLQQGLFGAQNAALERVNAMANQPFNAPVNPYTLGQVLDTSALPKMGSALSSRNLTAMGTPLDSSMLPGMGQTLNINDLPAMGDVFAGDRGNINVYDPNLQTNNATELILQRINPQLERDRETLRAQLANQGITQGTEAYTRAMRDFESGRNRAYQDAALQGIGLGMQQQGMQFDQHLQNRQLTAAEQAQRYLQMTGNRQLSAAEQAQLFGQQTTNRQQGVAEQGQRFDQFTTNRQLSAQEQAQAFAQQQALRAMEAQLQNMQFGQHAQNYQLGMMGQQNQFAQDAYLRSLPINELNALRTGNQVSMPQFPGYAQQATTGGPDMLGAAQGTYNAQLGAANAQNAANAGMFGGIASLGSAFLSNPAFWS